MDLFRGNIYEITDKLHVLNLIVFYLNFKF